MKQTITLRVAPDVARLISAVAERRMQSKSEWLRAALHEALAADIQRLAPTTEPR